MKIMLDLSPARIAELSKKYDYEFWQLRTPLTKSRLAGVPYGLDNGCFKRFHRDTWLRLVAEARLNRETSDIKFVCLPDIVGDAARTLDLFEHFITDTAGLPRALVLQDGIENFRINWAYLDAVFIGGSDSFKVSSAAFNAAKTAKMLGKWVHVGRVNTPGRLSDWMELADSIDGSGISRFDWMLKELIQYIKLGDSQHDLFPSLESHKISLIADKLGS